MPARRTAAPRTRTRLATLADVPEEILERILALILVQSPEPSRASWHPYQTPPSTLPNVISPLLVCRAWLRIATPVHYRHPVLRTPRHVELLLRALRYTPSLAPCIRSLHLHATSPALRDLIPLCSNLDTLDVTVDNADSTLTVTTGVIPAADAPSRDRGVVQFCEAFAKTRRVRHLVIRKNAYLTQPNAIYIFEQLAKAMTRWHKLETVNVAFRLSPSPAASALTKALATLPRLHTLSTMLPAVWNTTLLDIAQNPALRRIVLDPAPELAGAHLFLAEAKRHPRLVQLIHAGSPPPSPYPGHAGVAASSRARAASAVVVGKAPMSMSIAPSPFATWSYERDVPPPACPPASRRPSQAGYASGSLVGLSAYAPAPVAAPSVSYPGPGMQYPHQQQHHYVAAAHQYPAAHHPGQYSAYGTNAYPANAAARMQPSIVGGQASRRSAPGGRRMTAS
ncbi:hypothetical protein BD310DRAFT_908283 [Dichomitus squalens]|uniref:F-box domain-containing protein n=1 Tax=Dichomitus squalens TaxID=114155 RepID=A0A4V6MWQ0_9APHY|nr:hypothetical protein BD310DRAFT_908283 [Dichomitus squalens]